MCKVLGNILCDLDVKVHISHDVEGTVNISCNLDPKIKVQILYFLVNVSTPKRCGVATSNFSGA